MVEVAPADRREGRLARFKFDFVLSSDKSGQHAQEVGQLLSLFPEGSGTYFVWWIRERGTGRHVGYTVVVGTRMVRSHAEWDASCKEARQVLAMRETARETLVMRYGKP
jgi:hypothetical protein